MTFDALLLADGRFPAGSHVHSGGVEAAVRDGRVHDVATLDAFVRMRLATVGRTDAAFGAVTWATLGGAGPHEARAMLVEVDGELDARIAPPSVRAASRRLGLQLLRAAQACWADALLRVGAEAVPAGLHQPCATAVVGRAAGLDAAAVARHLLYQCASVPAQAGVRLLGLDPFAVTAVLASVAAVAEAQVRDAVALAASPPPLADLPACTSPLVDVAAVVHATWTDRLFAT